MEGQIPTGAYVVQNKQSSSPVLQIYDATFSSWSWVVVNERNETELYRDQQIWWVEELPKSRDNDEAVYSITNTSSGKALGLRGGDGTLRLFGTYTTYITASPQNGAPWQKWKIQSQKNQRGGTYYTFECVDNGQLLDIPDGTTWAISQERISERESQGWEFKIPKAPVPCGWLQIQNAVTGALLSHSYLSNPPTLVAPPSTTCTLPSYCRESWSTQWTLIRAQSYAPKSYFTTGPDTWCIRNRLTKGFLSNTPRFGITAWESDLLVAADTNFQANLVVKEYTWKLDLGPDRNWKITNHETLCLLEQVGSELVCTDERSTGNKSWLLI